MSEYDMMDLEGPESKKDMFRIDAEAFSMNYSNNPDANQIFNTSGCESNFTETEESLKALMAQHTETAIEPPKHPNRRPHPRMSWIFTHGYGSRVRSENGHMVQCCVNNCGRLYITNNGSTSAFKKHLEKVHGLVEFPDPSRPHAGPNPSENGANRPRKPYAPRKGRARELMSIKSEGKPPQGISLPLPIAQDGQLLNLLKYGGTPVDREILAPSNVMSANREDFSKTQDALKEILQSQLSISLSVDFWVNPHSEDVLCIMAHFISNTWESREVLLDMQIKKDMTGAEAANILINSLDTYGVTRLVSTITTNHSPMMQVMVEELGQLELSRSDFSFSISTDHIPCLGFIINSAANGALSLGEQSPAGSIMEKLNKMRLGISSISKTPHALGFYQNLFRLSMQEHLALIADELLRWDLTYQMAERLLLVHTAYNETCNNCGMAELVITQADLKLLEEVKNLLGPLQAFAVRVSTLRYPTITQALPLYDKVLVYLDSVGQTKPDFIQQAYQYVHQTFRSYFGKNNPNIYFAFAPVVDPRLKLKGWATPVYSKEDVESLTSFVKSYWEKSHNKSEATPCLNDFPQSAFDTIFEADHIPIADDLSRYLQEPIVGTNIPYDIAVIEFWRTNAQLYPQLARIARKFLNIPTTSIPCGRQLVYNRQLVSSTIKDPELIQMTREFSLLHSWRKIVT